MPTINTKPLVSSPSNEDILYLGVKEEEGYSDGYAKIGSLRFSPVVDVYASRVLGSGDEGAFLNCIISYSDIELTIPSEINDGAEWQEGLVIEISHYSDVNGGAKVIITPNYGVSINIPDGFHAMLSRGMTATLKRIGIDQWVLFGHMVSS